MPEAIDKLEAQVGQLDEVRDELQQRVSRASMQQEEAKDARLRIGRALDELASDESRISLEVNEMLAQLAEARARAEQVERPLREAWSKLSTRAEAKMDEGLLRLIRDAGSLAAIRLESARAAADLEVKIGASKRQLEDLAFQIAQLKGRFGSFSAVSDIDLDDLRDQTTDLDRRLQDKLDQIVQAAEPVVQHFMEFGHLREKVRGTRSSVGG